MVSGRCVAAPSWTQGGPVEKAVLAWWRERGATFASRDQVPAGDGYTETVHIGLVDVPDTIRYIGGLRAEPRR